VLTDGELSGRGTCIQIGVADRREGAAVSVDLLGNLLFCTVQLMLVG
jgi:hypothetical protein